MNPFLAQGGGSSATSTSGSGDLGDIGFGGFGGLSLGNDVSGIDPRWLIGGAVVVAVFLAILLTRKG